MKHFNSQKLIGSCLMLAVSYWLLASSLFAQNTLYKEKHLQVTKQKTNDIDEATLRKQMKADGVSAPVIDKLIAQRKIWLQKGKIVNWSNAKNAQTPVINAPCNGLGVEGGWGAWKGADGDNSAGPATNISWNAATNPPSGANFSITTGTGIDPNTPGPNAGNPTIPVVCPGFGSSSIVLNQNCTTGYVCEQLTYPLTVTPQDTNFIYAYAIVIEDAGHVPADQPFVEFGIYNSSGNAIACSFQHYVGGTNIPGFYPVSGNGCGYAGMDQYKPWTLVGINLSAYIGQTLNVVITNADCDQGGHFAYSYWDFLCGTSSLSAGCIGNQSTICGPIDPNIAYTYQWYNNGVAVPAPQGTQQCITVTAQPGDAYSVEVQQPSGCNFHMGYVPASIQPGFNSTGQCGTYTFSDTTQTSPSSVSITGWSWNFQGGTPATATTPSATVTYNSPGTYTVALTVTCSAGCTSTIVHTITVTALPTAAFSSSPACLGSNVILTNGSIFPTGDPITQWSWSMPGGTPATSTSSTTVATNYSTSGTHTVTLTVTTQSGCTSSIPQQVIVYTPPVANFTGSATGCLPVCVNNYNDASVSTNGNITGWQWIFPGGIPASYTSITAPGNPPSICYYSSGTYGASLIVTSQYGCKDSITVTPIVTPRPWPTADFCVTPDQVPATDPVFTFCPQWSSDVSQWTWNFGDGDTNVVNTNPVHSYSATVTNNDFYSYTICLKVKNQFGCRDSVCKQVEIIPEYEFYMPNTFTPNGDNMNETFFGKCRGVKDYNIWIFDRWDNMIWDCHYTGKNTDWDMQGSDGMSANCKWDGKVVGGGMDMSGGSGEFAQEDVYVWKVKLTDVFGKQHTYVGQVSVVK